MFVDLHNEYRKRPGLQETQALVDRACEVHGAVALVECRRERFRARPLSLPFSQASAAATCVRVYLPSGFAHFW